MASGAVIGGAIGHLNTLERFKISGPTPFDEGAKMALRGLDEVVRTAAGGAQFCGLFGLIMGGLNPGYNPLLAVGGIAIGAATAGILLAVSANKKA